MAQKIFMKYFLLIIILTVYLKYSYAEKEVRRTWFSSKGVECASPCSTKGENYLWCPLVSSSWDYCSTSPLLDYKGRKCENKCGHHGKSYEWCWTKNGDWGYCSREGFEVYVKHFGSTTGKECSSTCDKHHGTWYYWCRIDKSNWDYCSPNKGRNYAGTNCKTSCGKEQGTSYSWCNDNKGKWQYCSPVETTTNNSCSASRLNFPPSIPFKISGNSARISKRMSSSTGENTWNAYLDDENLCENLALNLRRNTPGLHDLEPEYGANNPINLVWYSGAGERRRSHMVHSIITQQHRECPRSNFGATFNRQMELMDARPTGDVKGHIVAARLCGPAQWYNLAPQTNALNINRDVGWYQKEEWFSEMLDQMPCVYLDHWVMLIYDGGNRRPEHFQLCYAFKNVVTHRVMLGPDTMLFRNE